MFTPCALTRLASVLKQNKEVRLLTAACGVQCRLEGRVIGGRLQMLGLAKKDSRRYSGRRRCAPSHTIPTIVGAGAARVYNTTIGLEMELSGKRASLAPTVNQASPSPGVPTRLCGERKRRRGAPPA
jgi:hypothetical protein